MKRLLLLLLIASALCVLVPAATAAQVAGQLDKAWGPYAQVAGRTAVSESGTTKARWYWVDPGNSLMQEYRRTQDDVVFRETLITLGSEPGTLVMAPRPAGMTPETPYVAALQPDGRLFLPRDAQTPDTGNFLELGGGGAVLVYSAARISDGRAVPDPADTRQHLRFSLDPVPAAVAAHPLPATVLPAPPAARPMLSPPATAERMTHWGKWGEQVGKTLRIYFITPTGYQEVGTESCTWVQPGVEMTCVESDAGGERETRYALGLDNRIRAFGINAAGHVVWDRYEDGSFGASYTTDDGMPLTVRNQFGDEGEVTAWVTRGSKSGLLVGLPDEPAGSAASRIAQVADAVRSKQAPAGAIASSVAASATVPLVGEAEAAALQSSWGPLSVLAGQDWVQHYLGFAKAQVPTRFSWAVPGRVLLAVDQHGTSIYRLAPDGTIIHKPAVALKGHAEGTLYPQAGGALVEYAPAPPPAVAQHIKAVDKRSRYFTYLEPNGQVSRWLHSADQPEIGVASSVYVPMDGSTGPAPQVLGAALRNPAAWGPVAALANKTVTTFGSPTFIFRVAEGGDVMHMLRMGVEQATPDASLALGPRGTIVRRDKSTRQGRDVGSFKEGYIVGNTVEWRYPGRAMDDFLIDHTWTVVEGEYDTTFTVGFPESGPMTEQKVELLRFDPKWLAPALAYLQGTSQGIAATVQAKGNEYVQRTSGNGTNQFLGAVSRALDVGNAYANEQAARSRAELDATIARANAQAAGQAAAQANVQPHAQPSSVVPGQATQAGEDQEVSSDTRRHLDQGTGSTLTPAAPVAKQCRTVTKTYSRRSLPKPSIAEAEAYIAGSPSACHLGVPPVMGPAECTEKSEPVVTKDAQGIPRVTGRQTLYTCEIEMQCPAAEICETESTGASAQ